MVARLLDVQLPNFSAPSAYVLDQRSDGDRDDTVRTGRVWLVWNHETANVAAVCYTRMRAVEFARKAGFRPGLRGLTWDVEQRRVQT